MVEGNVLDVIELVKKQVDVIADFIVDDDNAESKGKGGSRKSGRMTEKEEDKILLQNDTNVKRHTRLLAQPTIIKNGTMRDYQLEVGNYCCIFSCVFFCK
jgi:hypothetical protein